jgi:hypothetical protein
MREINEILINGYKKMNMTQVLGQVMTQVLGEVTQVLGQDLGQVLWNIGSYL